MSRKQVKWLLGVFVLPVLVAWFGGVLNQFLPGPKRAWLGITNILGPESRDPNDGFRFVLCWLENDDSGRDTEIVEDAFSGLEGIKLVRSYQIVAASGAADEWRPEMRGGAREVLDDWEADLAIVGSVKESGKVLSLWFVPREGADTLPRGDKPYVLKDVSLQEDFLEGLRAQLAIEALGAVAPLAETEVRGRVLDRRTAQRHGENRGSA